MAPKIKGMSIAQQASGFSLSCLSTDSYKLMVVSIDEAEIMGDNESKEILLSREAIKKYAFRIIGKAYDKVFGVDGDVDLAMKEAIYDNRSALSSEKNNRFVYYDKIIHKNYEKTTLIPVGKFNTEDKVFLFFIYEMDKSFREAMRGNEGETYICRALFINNNDRKYIIKEEEKKKTGFLFFSKKKALKDAEGPLNVYVAYATEEEGGDECPNGEEALFIKSTLNDANVYSRIFNYGGGNRFQMDQAEFQSFESGEKTIVSLASIISDALNN